MASSRLLFGWSNHPNLVAELAGDIFEEPQAPCIYAVVIGEENAHAGGYAGVVP
jgi:hypothetical protein